MMHANMNARRRRSLPSVLAGLRRNSRGGEKIADESVRLGVDHDCSSRSLRIGETSRLRLALVTRGRNTVAVRFSSGDGRLASPHIDCCRPGAALSKLFHGHAGGISRLMPHRHERGGLSSLNIGPLRLPAGRSREDIFIVLPSLSISLTRDASLGVHSSRIGAAARVSGCNASPVMRGARPSSSSFSSATSRRFAFDILADMLFTRARARELRNILFGTRLAIGGAGLVITAFLRHA